MPIDLARVNAMRLEPGTKGVPPDAYGRMLADIASLGLRLFDEAAPLPAAVVKRDALAANAAAMQAFLARPNLHLAPHGKTTMCPQLFARQLEAGAWGITVATVAQAALCHAIGVPRVLIANQVVGAAETAMLARLRADAPHLRCYVLVDSVAGAIGLHRAMAARPTAPALDVLVEIGFAGGRCGVRSIEEALTVAEAVSRLDRLRLRGVKGYEGLVATDDPVADAAWVKSYLDQLVGGLRAIRTNGLLATGERPLLSAGGSTYYDLVAAADALAPDADIVLRSGCYLTQDSGFYDRATRSVRARAGDAAPKLRNALEVWARVLSAPEPGRVILNAGKRDLSCDMDLPVPLLHLPQHGSSPQSVEGWRVSRLSDQHAFLDSDARTPATPLMVGDRIGLGVSHPCTTFDKWRVLLEVSDDYRVTGGLATFF